MGGYCDVGLDDAWQKCGGGEEGYHFLEYHLPLFAWSFAMVGVQDKPLMQLVVDKLASQVPKLVDWRLCSLAWAYGEGQVDPDFTQFRDSLTAELERRGISEARVKDTQLGFEAWLS